jgi:hypothetical protein
LIRCRLLIERLLGFAQPLAPAGAGPQLFRQLVAARLPVELVLGLVARLRLGDDLAGDPLIV